MGIFSTAGRTTNAPTATLPGFSLFAGAGAGGYIREIGIFNTTSTACAVSLQRFTATGTQGTALTEIPWDSDTAASACQGFNSHTVTPTITAGLFRQAVLGAATGAGVIWTFSGSGLIVPKGVANGYGILCPVGTGQVLDFYIDWEE